MAESRRRDLLLAALVFAVALGVRLLHLREVALHDPYYTLPTVDDVQYDAWARRFAEGKGFVDGVLYLGPGYPLFMAAVYRLFGPELAAVKAVQAVLGAGTCVLVFGLTRALFDRRAATVAGLLSAGYAMLVFYGGTIMTVNAKVPLVVGCVWATVAALRSPTVVGFAGAGGLLGLAVLVQQTALPFVVLVVLGLLTGIGAGATTALPLARRALLAAVFVVACFAPILPATLHNLESGRDFVLLNSMGGPNFYMGNQPEADGTWQVPALGFRTRADNPDEMQRQFKAAAERAVGRSLRPSEVSAHWMQRGLASIASDPLRWLRLELRKLGLHLNAYEVWNIRPFELSREGSWVLRLPLATLGVVAPLGLLGIVQTRRRWRELAPVYAMMLVYLAGSLLFFVLARYRIPGMILLIPFAAAALVSLGESVQRREWRALGFALGLLATFAALVHLPLESSQGRMHMAYYNLANKYRELERWDEAIDAYQKSLRELPGAISTLNNLALAYELGGRREEAIATWRQVLVRARRNRDHMRVERANRHLESLGAATRASDVPERPDAPEARGERHAP